ncbi:MAG: LamB/YcsF family protein [Desulfurispora sp.]|uniref:LamB/YcsF family protein n=1 Tax=Desulfurispora sp. TaxID=3014275 RepID=UPI004049E8E5
MDLNVDMGESFGRYKLGHDEAVMPHITSANIACGFHASDPLVMYNTVLLAKKYGVAVGAHTGLQDLRGFGRRRLDITPEELTADTLYQLGALDGIARTCSVKLQHVKPHGILYRMVSEEEKYAQAFLDAIAAFNPELYIFVPRQSLIWEMGQARQMRMAAEILVDLSYDDQGNWVLEREKQARSPEEVAARAVMVARDNKITTISGRQIAVEADTICCHGDAPNAPQVVQQIRAEFTRLGIPLASLSAR